MIKFTVLRDSWIRGDENPKLLRPEDGKRCCLGFLAKTMGLTDYDISGVGDPTGVRNIPGKNDFSDLLTVSNMDFRRPSKVCSLIIKANDDFPYKLANEINIFPEEVNSKEFKYRVKPEQLNVIEQYREDKLKKLFSDLDVEVEFV